MGFFRKSGIIITVLFVVCSMSITPAYAWSIPFCKDKGPKDSTHKKLDKIEEQVQELQENTKLMKFINKNMIDQDIEGIAIKITDNDRVRQSYYIHRSDPGQAAIIDSHAHNIDWVFMPTIKQTESGLRTLKSKKLTPGNVIQCIYLYFSVENKGVPDIYTLIDNAPWIDEFLPKWL